MYPSTAHNRVVGLPSFISTEEYRAMVHHIVNNELDTGVVSEGTTRPQDLIPRFLSVVREYAPAEYEAFVFTPFTRPPAHAMEDDSAEWWYSEDASHLIDELIMTLEDHAPEGTYFGLHEDDGACWGFWPSLCEEE